MLSYAQGREGNNTLRPSEIPLLAFLLGESAFEHFTKARENEVHDPQCVVRDQFL